mmetsp:Transcript_76189/g.240929  ORF Transcript_76189/g.240929 Transcript_76189/m.240929 type:complete len:247 (-) Transcript_76189:95-835(-)
MNCVMNRGTCSMTSMLASEPSGLMVPAIRFNNTLGGLRLVLRALAFTPYPELFHGVVHFSLEVVASATGEVVHCDVGLVVHPMNSAPVITVDLPRLTEATDGGIVHPQQHIHLAGLLALSDPDDEAFTDWFAKRTHSARLRLSVSCGTMSFGVTGDTDYKLGKQGGSIAGTEGMTFHEGDGTQDPVLDVTSTLDHLNGELHRLIFHSLNCRGVNVTLAVDLDDLGHFGAGGPRSAHRDVLLPVSMG